MRGLIVRIQISLMDKYNHEKILIILRSHYKYDYFFEFSQLPNLDRTNFQLDEIRELALWRKNSLLPRKNG